MLNLNGPAEFIGLRSDCYFAELNHGDVARSLRPGRASLFLR